MKLLRLLLPLSICSSLVASALLIGCGQTTGPLDSGPGDVLASDQGSDAPDLSAPDAALDTSARDVTPFDAGTVDGQADGNLAPDITFPDASTGCNTTVNDGPAVSVTMGTGMPPAGMGGTIVPGHYQLTSIAIYGSAPPPFSLAESIDLTATTLNAVAAAAGMPEQRVRLSYSVSGANFNQMQECPAGGSSGSNQFTADATHFIIIGTMSGVTTVGTFTLH